MLLEKSIHELIDSEHFTHYSQDLFSTDNWEKIGEEIFLRSEIANPEAIFQGAKKAHRLYELETKSILKVLKAYDTKKAATKSLIFINLYPSTITHPEFLNFIKKITIDFPILKSSIVFEIIETEKIEDMVFFKERISFLKKFGFFIAIDDFGKGWSSVSIIIELEPHYLKLDKYFSLQLSNSMLKQEMIKSLLIYSESSNVKVILEGIEMEKDLLTAQKLGIHICQGFLLSRPLPLSS